jgi:hypothetical protein
MKARDCASSAIRSLRETGDRRATARDRRTVNLSWNSAA